MKFKINKIYLTTEDGHISNYYPKMGNTDVVVSLEDGKKFIASFFAFSQIDEMRIQHQKNGEFLGGSYFWDKNMVMVENCSLKNIEPVVYDLIDEGNFWEAFREL